MTFRKENVILNTKLLYSVQCIVQLEGSCVDGSRCIGVYSHTKCTLKACCNNIVLHQSSLSSKFYTPIPIYFSCFCSSYT
jgi:hypothetical protein